MTKPKSETKSDKMMKPSKAVRPFNFPAHGVTVDATDTHDAEKKLQDHLKPKSKKDD
jgi:hypothetical protein